MYEMNVATNGSTLRPFTVCLMLYKNLIEPFFQQILRKTKSKHKTLNINLHITWNYIRVSVWLASTHLPSPHAEICVNQHQKNAMSKSSIAEYNVGSIKYNNKWVFFHPSIWLFHVLVFNAEIANFSAARNLHVIKIHSFERQAMAQQFLQATWAFYIQISNIYEALPQS